MPEKKKKGVDLNLYNYCVQIVFHDKKLAYKVIVNKMRDGKIVDEPIKLEREFLKKLAGVSIQTLEVDENGYIVTNKQKKQKQEKVDEELIKDLTLNRKYDIN